MEERGGDGLGLDHSILEEQTEINEITTEMGSVDEDNPDEEMNQEGAEGVEEGEGEGVHGTKCFKNLIDKPVAEEIKLFEWCPTMDLLAWITADDQLIVQRLSWQRLFSIRTHDQPITALTWRPDGKIIAVGHKDGKISLVDVENGTAYFSSQFHSASVTCLHWAQETPVGAPPAGALQHAHIHYLVDRTERFLQPLPLPPLQGQPSDGAVDMATTTNAAARMPPPNQLNILVSGDETGKVILSALGTFCVGMADIRAMANSQQAQAMKVNLSADLKHLYIAIEGTLDWEYLTVREDGAAQYSFLSPLPPPKTPSSFSSSSMSPESSPTLALIDINTSLLWSRRQELKLIAVQSAYISSHLSHIDTTLQLMGDKWGHSIGEFNTRCSDFSNMLQENNSTTTVRQELLYFLVTGVPSADLERFLLNTLTESGVRKMGKGIEAGCARLEELLITHLKPASETLLFRLSELQGRAKWYEQFGIIGLEEESLSFLLQKASLFIRRTEELAKTLSELKRKYSAFFNWLLAGTLRLADMLTRRRMRELVPIDEKAVSDFLNDNLGKDLIAPFFKEAATDANPEGQAAATATATPTADNSMLLPSPGGVGAMSQSDGLSRLSGFGSATPSFARRIASHPSPSPFMLSSSISPFTNVSPRSTAFQLPGQGVASTPARPSQNSFSSSQLHPRGVNPVTALGSLSAFSTPSPASGSAASSSSFAGTPATGGLPRFSPSSIAASVARMQLSAISAFSTPSSALRGGYSRSSSHGPTPSFVAGLSGQTSTSVNAHGGSGSSLGGSAPSLKQMFSDMAAIYEETFIMPSQTLAKSFTIDSAIPLLAIKMETAAAAKPAPSSAVTAPAEPPKPKEKRERNYWEEDDDDEAEAEAEETAAADAGFNHQQPAELDDEGGGDEGEGDEEEEEIPDQVLTAFFTETIAEEGSRNDSGLSLHLTAFHSSAPMPASLQDALGGDASFSFLDDTSAVPSPKRYVWLLRKRHHFNPRQHRRRQGLEELATVYDAAANAKLDEDYSVGALRLPRDNAEVMHLSFYNKDTLAVLSCATTFNVDHSIDPLAEPEGVVETVLELLPITDVTFVPIPDRCQLSSSRMNLVQRMLADKSFVSSAPSEVKSRLQPPNAAGAAVSGTRNVAAVYAAPKRLLFYDLLDEEEEEEDEDEEEGGADEEEAEGVAGEEEEGEEAEGEEATATTNTSHMVRDGEEEEEEECEPVGSRDGSFMDE